MPYYFHWYTDYRLKNTHPVYPTEQNTGINFSYPCSGLSTTLLKKTTPKQEQKQKTTTHKIKPAKYKTLLRIAFLHKLFQHFGSLYT